MPSMRSYVAAHYIRNLTNSHCLPWLLRQQKTKISWKIAKLWPCVNYTYLVQPISTWAAHSMMIIKIEHQSQLASDLSGHILSWKAISKLGTLRVFINLEFDSHFLIKVQARWKKRLCIILNIQQNFDFLFLSICVYLLSLELSFSVFELLGQCFAVRNSVFFIKKSLIFRSRQENSKLNPD